MAKPDYDWDDYRHRYVTSNISLADLAELPNAPHPDTIRRRAAAEGWTAEREAYRHQVTIETQRVTGLDQSQVAARHVKIARAVQAKALAALDNVQPDDLSPWMALHFLQVGVKIEREALTMHGGSEDHSNQLLAIAEALERARDIN